MEDRTFMNAFRDLYLTRTYQIRVIFVIVPFFYFIFKFLINFFCDFQPIPSNTTNEQRCQTYRYIGFIPIFVISIGCTDDAAEW